MFMMFTRFFAALPGHRFGGGGIKEERAYLIRDGRKESAHLGTFYERFAASFCLPAHIVCFDQLLNTIGSELNVNTNLYTHHPFNVLFTI
jgi:hypothetical protein